MAAATAGGISDAAQETQADERNGDRVSERAAASPCISAMNITACSSGGAGRERTAEVKWAMAPGCRRIDRPLFESH